MMEAHDLRRPLLIVAAAGLVMLAAGGCRQTPAAADADADHADRPATLDEAMAMLDRRPDWQDAPPIDLARHPAEKYLAGWVIVLDPGHGGLAHRAGYKRGPTGVREAEVNWRVALLLQRLLEDAGAHVLLTRDGDVDVSLEARAQLANNVDRPDGGKGADVFLSLHHNASSSPETNFTSVWYHGEVDWSPVGLDIARCLAQEIGRSLRTQVATTSPLMSDQQIYKSGFGVLRRLRVPGVLIESSFHSNPAEEQRLRDAVHNLREAYAIYVGLCEYAYGGRPAPGPIRFEVDGQRTAMAVTLGDGLPDWWGHERNRIFSHSIALLIDGLPVPFAFDGRSRELTAAWPRRQTCELTLQYTNMFGHHNWPYRFRVTTVEADGTWSAEAAPLPQVRYMIEDEPPARAGETPMHRPKLRPWESLPDLSLPVALVPARPANPADPRYTGLDDLIDLPAGSSLSLARIDEQGRVVVADWRGTGDRGFYPASTIKWITGAMTLAFMAEHDCALDTVIQVGDDRPASIRLLLQQMIVVSDNEAFNTLQEAVGFAETYDAMRAWGVRDSVIRRHFTRPHYNSSRAVQIYNPDGSTRQTIPGRPPAAIPLNRDADDPASGNGEANWFTTDDLVRVMAATLGGPTRRLADFSFFADSLARTDQCFVREGLARLTAESAGRPVFVVLNKPGWWPPDGVNVDAVYIYDQQRGEHYLLAHNHQGTVEAAKAGVANAADDIFRAIHDGRLQLEAP